MDLCAECHLFNPWYLLIAAAIAATLLIPMRRGRADALQAAKLLQAGAVLVDVRSRAEFARGHLATAIHIPLAQCLQGTVDASALDKPIIVYCASGARSALAARSLRKFARGPVYDLGSMHRWRDRLVTAPADEAA